MLEYRLKAVDVSFCNMVLLLDTGAVISRYNNKVFESISQGWNGLQKLDLTFLQSQVSAAQKARKFLYDRRNVIIVPEEVRDEVQNHLRLYRNKTRVLSDENHCLKKKRSEIACVQEVKLESLRNYIIEVDFFYRESEGRDPRYHKFPRNYLCFVPSIDEGGEAYKQAHVFYSRAVTQRHQEKNQPPSAADIALATLSFLIQQRTRKAPYIVTHDGDFLHLALSSYPGIHRKEESYRDAFIYHLSSPSYSVGIYMPRL